MGEEPCMKKNITISKISCCLLLFVGLLQPVFSGEVTVSAAASLTDAFKEIARNYQAKYPTDKVLLNFGASGSLLHQIDKGAPVNIFASADQEAMDQAQQKRLIQSGTRVDFVKNNLVVIIPSESKLKLNKLADLKQKQVKRIALGNPASVPVGRYSKTAMEKYNVWHSIQDKIIHTQNVRQSLDYVARGEVDAGFVYGTDAKVMSNKVKVSFIVPLDVAITYPIAEINQGKNKNEAKRFIAYILSKDSQKVLAKYGFLKP